ncbi:MAG: SOS response-associated peptidase [Brevundimonas sp.]|nr:MAG: SOS response-associated peptidase [Brevundimonas sp.]
MCASYESRFTVRQLVDLFAEAGAPLVFPGGLPNLEPVDEIRPTDSALVVRAAVDAETCADMMRFGFPPPAPKRPPVINLRSEGRRFSNGPAGGRCLIPTSGFYEFTGDKYPKTRWKLSAADGGPLLLAAVWRAGADGQPDAFALLTAEPGPDIAPYHDRGVIPLPSATWGDWLFDRRPADDILAPPPAGTLAVTAAPRPR